MASKILHYVPNSGKGSKSSENSPKSKIKHRKPCGFRCFRRGIYFDLTTWKENHILIEFPTPVANGVARLQMDTPGCKSRGAVAQTNFYRKKEELHHRVYRSERDVLRCLDEYIIYYNSQCPHRYNGYKTPDDAEKMFEESMLSGHLS